MTAMKRDAAQRLANLHRQAEPLLRRVFLLHSASDSDVPDTIKLLEVVEGAVEAGVLPIFFRAEKSLGIEYASVVVELSPSEYERIAGDGAIEVDGFQWSVGEELLSE